MAAADLSTGPSGGDVFDVDIADENRILPIVFNFVLAFHTIGVRRSKFWYINIVKLVAYSIFFKGNETLLAKLNKAGKQLISWFTEKK